MNILFFTHETSRTGAPHMLLYFMQWIKAHYPDHKMYVVSLKKGEISQQFAEVAHTLIELDDIKPPETIGLKKQLLHKLRPKTGKTVLDILKKTIRDWDLDMLYANTVISLPYAYALKDLFPKSKLLVHAHELTTIIKLVAPDFSKHKNKVNHFIAASDLVKNSLAAHFDVPGNQVTRIYECSKTNDVVNNTREPLSSGRKIIIGGSGTVHWRKGSDLFLQVALQFIEKYPDVSIEFRWIGNISNEEHIIMQEDLRKVGLSDKVLFAGPSDNPFLSFQEFDLFLMTSREDPFPLVCIEVGLLGVPIICFDGATGTQEVITDCGTIVPYLNTVAMAGAIQNYISDDALYIRHSKAILEVFNAFAPEHMCPMYYDVLKTVYTDA